MTSVRVGGCCPSSVQESTGGSQFLMAQYGPIIDHTDDGEPGTTTLRDSDAADADAAPPAERAAVARAIAKAER